MISSEFLDSFLKAAVLMASPLILASIGGVIAELSGVMPVPLEGLMLSGAFMGVVGSNLSGSPWIGALFAMATGAVLSLIFAYLTVTRGANHMVIGLSMNLLCLGLTNWLAPILIGGTMQRVNLYPVIAPESWQSIPIIGPLLISQPVIVWIALILPFISYWIIRNTTWGLNVRSVGENPEAAESAGLPVHKIRYLSVILLGIFGGLAGSALSLAELGLFVTNMTAGRGFIVMASHVVGRWNPLTVALAALLFGSADALAIRIQIFDIGIPYQAIVVIPYVITIIALAGFVGRTHTPKALGKYYKSSSS